MLNADLLYFRESQSESLRKLERESLDEGPPPFCDEGELFFEAKGWEVIACRDPGQIP